MTTDFDYNRRKLAVAIWNYAFRIALQPADERSMEPLRAAAAEALQEIRTMDYAWMPRAETYKGRSKKYAGMIGVIVSTGDSFNDYGWLVQPREANKLMHVLDAIAAAYNQSLEIADICECAERAGGAS